MVFFCVGKLQFGESTFGDVQLFVMGILWGGTVNTEIKVPCTESKTSRGSIFFKNGVG